MSSGRPSHASRLLGHWDVLKIAVPITLSNATVPLVGFVDTAVVGQLGVPHLMGGVAIGGLIFSMLYWGFGFLRMGTTGLTAQAFGAQDRRETAGHLLRALMVAGTAGIAMVLLQRQILGAAFWLVGGSAEVRAAATQYYDIRIWAAPAGLVNFALLGWFIGLGRAGVAFAIQLFLNLSEMALSVLLGAKLGWAVAGVGTAALVAEYAAAIVGLVTALVIARRIGARAPLSDMLDWPRLARASSINADILVRSIAAYVVHAHFTSQGAAAGDVVLAANAVLISIKNITIYLLDGFAFAAEALVGRSVGARDRAEFRRAVHLSTIWAAGIAIVMTLAIGLGGPVVIAFAAKSAEVQAAALTYLAWAAVAPILGVWCFQLDGIFVGATRTRDMRNMMIVSVAAYLACAMLLVPVIGNHGLWAAYMLFYLARAMTLLSRFPALQRAAFPRSATPL